MEKGNRFEVEALKNRITQATAQWRVLRTHSATGGPNVATFVGTSNTRVASIIDDATGLRRFYELVCQPKLDWNVINAIEYAALWSSVNEEGPSPVETVLDGLRARQQQMMRAVPSASSGTNGPRLPWEHSAAVPSRKCLARVI